MLGICSCIHLSYKMLYMDMKMKFDGFQWDKGNIEHCAKHDVSRDEIEHVLTNMTFFIPDPFPDEPRLRTAGKTPQGRHIFIVFMFKELEGNQYIRPISARYMHEKEVKSYEQHTKT